MENLIKELQTESKNNEYLVHILTNYMRIRGVINTDLSQLYDDENAEKVRQIKNIIENGEKDARSRILQL